MVMKQVRLDLPELGYDRRDPRHAWSGDRPFAGDRLTRDQRRAVGVTLTIIGLVTTIPAIWAVCGNAEKKTSVPLA
jgi:hypothetical protein